MTSAPSIDPVADAVSGRAPSRRRMARIAAVQALYQAEITGTAMERVAREFNAFQIGRDIDGFVLDADRSFFNRLAAALPMHRERIDALLVEALTTGRALANLETVLRCILVVGACELAALEDVPPRVTINEYVDIADDFFGRSEAGLVNAMLDRIAQRIRPSEL